MTFSQWAKDNGIEKIIIPAVDLDSSRTAIMLSGKYEMLYCALVFIILAMQIRNEVNIIDEIENFITHEKLRQSVRPVWITTE